MSVKSIVKALEPFTRQVSRASTTEQSSDTSIKLRCSRRSHKAQNTPWRIPTRNYDVVSQTSRRSHKNCRTSLHRQIRPQELRECSKAFRPLCMLIIPATDLDTNLFRRLILFPKERSSSSQLHLVCPMLATEA